MKERVGAPVVLDSHLRRQLGAKRALAVERLLAGCKETVHVMMDPSAGEKKPPSWKPAEFHGLDERDQMTAGGPVHNGWQ